MEGYKKCLEFKRCPGYREESMEILDLMAGPKRPGARLRWLGET